MTIGLFVITVSGALIGELLNATIGERSRLTAKHQ
jgi:hypothetical protein